MSMPPSDSESDLQSPSSIDSEGQQHATLTTPDSRTSWASRTSSVKLSFVGEVALLVRVGLKKNRIPSCIAITVGSLVLVLYYAVPDVTFAALQDAEKAKPYLFAATASTVCGGLLPLILQIVMTKQAPKPFSYHLVWTFSFWSFLGVWCKTQYSIIAFLLGSEVKASVVVAKTLLDQFVISPFINYLWITPCFRFRDKQFSFSEFVASFRDHRSLALQYISMNVCNWSTWLPAMLLIYSLPLALQMPTWAVIMMFYSCLLMFVSADASRQSKRDAEELSTVCNAPAAEAAAIGSNADLKPNNSLKPDDTRAISADPCTVCEI